MDYALLSCSEGGATGAFRFTGAHFRRFNRISAEYNCKPCSAPIYIAWESGVETLSPVADYC
jgi:hypothetical protein